MCVCACVYVRACVCLSVCLSVCVHITMIFTQQARLLKEICHFAQSVKSKDMYQVSCHHCGQHNTHPPRTGDEATWPYV